jgi:ATP-dependent Clp protease adaptor protein ClpS
MTEKNPQNPSENGTENDTQVITEEKVELKRPDMYRIILLNDDYTPMDFVVWLLETVFHKSKEESVRLMLKVHQQGSTICGIYPYDVARTKVFHVKGLAQKHEHPLECLMEVEGGDKT